MMQTKKRKPNHAVFWWMKQPSHPQKNNHIYFCFLGNRPQFIHTVQSSIEGDSSLVRKKHNFIIPVEPILVCTLFMTSTVKKEKKQQTQSTLAFERWSQKYFSWNFLILAERPLRPWQGLADIKKPGSRRTTTPPQPLNSPTWPLIPLCLFCQPPDTSGDRV